MKLPCADRAVVSDDKLYGYVLKPNHDVGKHHARLFERLLGIDRSNADVLRKALLHAAQTCEAVVERLTPHGMKYEIPFPMHGVEGRAYTVMSVWQIDHGFDIPRLVTAFVE